ncbi:alkyl sulfatase dimerization domain-containing protein [Thioalkalivibrio sp.]|uniref:alkyl sulfatase dimerization domain-containing protein n=1 Tax=Thioalkalivibrio sp. TaxID=2093813 RepID=UPI0039760C56
MSYYRDAMQYVHDQSVRLMNMGFTPDEMAETIEYYGNVDVSARNVYGGYISWWNGDPAELRPTPRLEQARRTVEMMGGRDDRHVPAPATADSTRGDAAKGRTGTGPDDTAGPTLDHDRFHRLDETHLYRLHLPRLTATDRGPGQGRLGTARQHGSTQEHNEGHLCLRLHLFSLFSVPVPSRRPLAATDRGSWS